MGGRIHPQGPFMAFGSLHCRFRLLLFEYMCVSVKIWLIFWVDVPRFIEVVGSRPICIYWCDCCSAPMWEDLPNPAFWRTSVVKIDLKRQMGCGLNLSITRVVACCGPSLWLSILAQCSIAFIGSSAENCFDQQVECNVGGDHHRLQSLVLSSSLNSQIQLSFFSRRPLEKIVQAYRKSSRNVLWNIYLNNIGSSSFSVNCLHHDHSWSRYESWSMCRMFHNLSLVGGLVAIFWIFPEILGIIIPIDVHIFQRGSNHQPDPSFSPLFPLCSPCFFPIRAEAQPRDGREPGRRTGWIYNT